MKRLGLILLAMLSTACLQARTIEIGIEDVVSEYYPDIVTLVQTAYRNLGHDVSTVRLPGEQSIALFKLGLIDAEIMRLEGYKRVQPTAIKVDVVLAYLPIQALVHHESDLVSIDQLEGKRMAAVRGVRVMDIALEMLAADVSFQSTFDISARMVTNRRADFLVASPEIVQSLLDQNYPLRVIEPVLAQVPFYHWVTPENADLIPALTDEFLRLLNQ